MMFSYSVILAFAGGLILGLLLMWWNMKAVRRACYQEGHLDGFHDRLFGINESGTVTTLKVDSCVVEYMKPIEVKQ